MDYKTLKEGYESAIKPVSKIVMNIGDFADLLDDKGGI